MSENYDMSAYEGDLDNLTIESDESTSTNSTNVSTEDNATEQPAGNEGGSLEDQLKAFNGDEKSEETDQPSGAENGEEQTSQIMDMVSELGILRHGLPVEIESEEQLKELISKGYDYTVKSQEAAAELEQGREQLQSEIQEANTLVEGKITEANEILENNQAMVMNNQIISDIVNELESSDPDLFEILDQKFTEKQRSMNAYQHNPAYQKLTQQNNSLEERLNAIEGNKSNDEMASIKTEWEDGFKSTSSEYGKQLKSLGIKADWNKIQSNWSSDETGKTTVQAALFAVHGQQITKALEAKARIAGTKAKVGNLTNSGNANVNDSAPSEKPMRDPYTNMDYLQTIASRHEA